MIILLILIISIILSILIAEKLLNNFELNIKSNINSRPLQHHRYVIENENYKNYYRPKRYVITLNELKFYNILMEIAKELDLILFSQVSLYNILETKKNLDPKTKQIYFNKIASKSIDFVLVNKKDCKIQLCIELDDSTHRQARRIKRDEFINKLFQDLEINLLRYPVYNVYYKETLKRKIQENIKEHYYTE